MDMKRLMEQAQQMQRKLKKIEQQLNETEYTGVSGGSSGVSVKINGKNEVIEVNISEELLEKENKEELQDMILLAVNSAVDQAKTERDEKLGAVTQGVSFPGM